MARRRGGKRRGRPAEPEAAAATEHEAEPGDPEALARRGREALEAYDYEAAQALLEQAVERSHGAPGPAETLLELLVDHLAADDEALDWEPRLPQGTRERPAVGALLALAGARSGDLRRAAGLLGDQRGPRAAEVHRLLCAVARREGELEAARRHLEEAREMDPAAPELASLEEALSEARADRRRPLEDELLRLLEGAEDDEAERRARALLTDRPGSEVAARVLREVEGRRRRAAADAALAEAETRAATGEHAAAAARLREALELGADPARVRPRLEEAEHKARAARAEERVEAVVRALASPDREAGLLAWLALDGPLRERARREAGDAPELGWLVEAGAPATGAGAKAAVRGALALAAGREALAAGEPDEALGHLTHHERFVEAVAEGRELQEAAEARRAGERTELAQARLSLVEEALAAGDAAAAREHLEALDRAALPEGAAGRVEEAVGQAARLGEVARLAEVLEGEVEAGALVAARTTAGRIAGLCEGEARPGWLARQAEIDGSVRREWCIRNVELPDKDLPLPDLELRAHEETRTWLSDDGRELVVPTVRGRWVFVRVLDVETSRARRAAVLRCPERFVLSNACLDSGTLWLLGTRGEVVQLELDGWRPVRHRSLAGLLRAGEVLEQAEVVPGGRTLWITTSSRTATDGPAYVLDVAGWRIQRDVGPTRSVWVLRGPKEARLARVAGGRELSIHAPSGARVTSLTDLSLYAHYGGVVSLPDGGGVAALVTEERYEAGHAGLVVLLKRPEGDLALRWPIGDGDGDAWHAAASASAEHGVYVHYRGPQGEPRLRALRTEGENLEEMWRCDVPRTAALCSDPAGARVCLLALDERSVQVRELGANTPYLRPARAPVSRAVPGLGLHACRHWPPHLLQAVAQAEARLQSWPAEHLASLLDDEVGRPDADPSWLLAMVHALGERRGRDLAGDFLRRIRERFPDDLALAAEEAHRAAVEEDWDEVVRLAEPMLADRAYDEHGAHLHHLVGLARLHGGDVAGAEEALRVGATAPEDPCRLRDLVGFVREAYLERSGDDDGALGLVRRLYEADACLERGDAEGAIALLDWPYAWSRRETQSLGRLAAAFLATLPGDPTTWYRKTMALAAFDDRMEQPPGGIGQLHLPLPGAGWDRERLEEVAERARAWLEDPQPVPPGVERAPDRRRPRHRVLAE